MKIPTIQRELKSKITQVLSRPYFTSDYFQINLRLTKKQGNKKNLEIKDGPILGELLQYLSKELAYKRLNNFDEAIYKAKRWIEQNAPKCD